MSYFLTFLMAGAFSSGSFVSEAFLTSSSVILPSGPVPVTFIISTPKSFANFLTAGVAETLSSVGITFVILGITGVILDLTSSSGASSRYPTAPAAVNFGALTSVVTFSPSWGDEFLSPLFRKYGARLILINTSNPSVRATLELLEKINQKSFTVKQ